MADQVAGLETRGISSCAAINGLLSMPERADVLDHVRLGDIGILIVSPEQLRNRAIRKVLAQREIGAWVLDEAHCLSKWGHDFRPDYRYVGRFIKEKAGLNLRLFDGGANRANLEFVVVQTTVNEKFSDIYQLLQAELRTKGAGVIYFKSLRPQIFPPTRHWDLWHDQAYETACLDWQDWPADQKPRS
jgi:ATP-dependent DNA helicase RecQ